MNRRNHRHLGLASVACLILAAGPAFAFRPFKATDADVVDAGVLEIEFGTLTIERDDGETGYIVPSLVLNYGLADRLELVGEFELEKPAGTAWQVVDPGLFLKAVLREGALQDRSGLSIAVEAGALLPSTREGEKDVGGEAILIASGRHAPVTYHVNLGGGVDRAGNAFWTWGLIGEAPVSQNLTLAAEFAGEDAAGTASDHSALVGARFSPQGSEVVFDTGIRRGISSASPDWTVTAGLMIAF